MHGMSFYWDTNIGEFLFKGLNINGIGPLCLLSLVLLILTVTYEAFKVYQSHLKAKTARQHQSPPCAQNERTNLLEAAHNRQGYNSREDISGGSSHVAAITRSSTTGTGPAATVSPYPPPKISNSKKCIKYFGQAAIFALHTTLGYILMLTVMVYNGYVFLIVVLGMGLGYFLFGHISMRINMENIRSKTLRIVCTPKCENAEAPGSGNHSTLPGGGTPMYTNESSLSLSEASAGSNETQITQIPKVEIHSGAAMNSSNSSHPDVIIDSCRL